MAYNQLEPTPAAHSKSLLRKLKKQLEFYFSDSNIQKDRYLRGLIEADQHGFVALQEFLKFNRVREMTEQEDTIRIALEFEKEKRTVGSVVLELNESRTAVRRTTPIHFEPDEDLDQRTLYIDCLPPNCDDRMLRSAFAQFGAISYVSVPKFRTSGQPCGFAFIEFRSLESAQTAIKTLGCADGYRNFIANLPKTSNRLQTIASLAQELEKLDLQSFRSQKAPRRSRNGSVSHQPAGEKTSSSSGLRKRSLSVNASNDQEAEVAGPTKSKRNRAADYASTSHCQVDAHDNDRSMKSGDSSTGVRYFVVLSKKDWLSKKDTDPFREQHRERCRLFRQALKQVSDVPESQHNERAFPVNQQKASTVNDSPMKPDFDGVQKSNQKQKQSEKLEKIVHQQSASTDSNSDVLPGTVIRFICDSSTDKKRVKNALATHANDIAYIDVIDGATCGYVRVKSTDSMLLMALGLKTAHAATSHQAGSSAKNSHADSNSVLQVPGYRFELLSGQDENIYWNKIINMRNAKLQRAKTKQNAKRDLVLEEQARPNNEQCTELSERKHFQGQANVQRQHIVFDD